MWKFVKSGNDYDSFLKHNENEICFWGRSNVGKSTLINSLTDQKISRVSKTPGRTRLINYFEDNNHKIMVDLPGYGYANMSKDAKEKMFQTTIKYINQAEKLQDIFILIDSRIGITKIDLEIIDLLIQMNKTFSLIYTKIDKLNQSEKSKIAKDIQKYQFKNLNNLFYISSLTHFGFDKLILYITKLLYNK
ncbi:MAG: ribosome biogenesis GTP-binding protein YihA/YsxC [Metamycoplasmataceae bacterium]